MKNITIAILAALVIVFAFLFFTRKNAPVANTPWPETVPAHTQTATGCKSTDPASIVVNNPVAGASYVTGQHVVIKWKSCNVGTVSLGLVMGGKSFGEISTENPISASTGSYEWIATNPAVGFTGSNTNSYQLVISSGDVMAKSGTFSVTTPTAQTLSPHFLQVLVDGGKIDKITRFTYNGSIYYSAVDFEVIAADGQSNVYNSSGTVVAQCGGMVSSTDQTLDICKDQLYSQTEVVYSR